MLSASQFHRQRKNERLFLAFCWCGGLICGILAYSTAGVSFAPMMRGAAFGAVSIAGLLGITTLPFLISAFAVSFSMAWLLFPVCFCKAFAFSFVSMGVLQAFGSAGWLVRLLLLFSDCTGMPLLYGFWLRHLPGCHSAGAWEKAFLFAAFMLLGSVDYRII